jgi:hypothetical protein
MEYIPGLVRAAKPISYFDQIQVRFPRPLDRSRLLLFRQEWGLVVSDTAAMPSAAPIGRYPTTDRRVGGVVSLMIFSSVDTEQPVSPAVRRQRP